MIKMNTFIADELENKIYHLTKALNQTQDILKTLEEENTSLKEQLQILENTLEQEMCGAT